MGDRRLLTVGLSFRQTYPADRELESSLGVGPLIASAPAASCYSASDSDGLALTCRPGAYPRDVCTSDPCGQCTHVRRSPVSAEALIPAGLGIALVRETGPLTAGLLLSGRIGAGIGAEIGAMKVTEQIDALESLAVDSFR